jgi:predicted esterase YcpF (UPF0227 family)
LEELVILSKDDEIIDYKDTLEKYSNCVVLESGGHRLENIEDVKEEIQEFVNRIF